MRIFLTGANGFIGGAVASALIADGHSVRGLVRSEEKAALVRARGVEPVIGSLDDRDLLEHEARQADGVVNAADSDHRGAAEALIAGLAGTGKALVHTSGSSIISDEAMGEPSERIFYEDTPIDPLPDKAARVAIDRLVLNAPGVRSAVLCNTMIYGDGAFAKQAGSGAPFVYVGRGLNRWSNAHIDDVAALYVLAVKAAPAGSFIYVESGEAALGDVIKSMAKRLGLGEPQSLPADQAVALLGRELAVFGLGSNSRVRGALATQILGWTPTHHSITDWIEKTAA